jgi:uncharacterized protein with LGFP repeats
VFRPTFTNKLVDISQLYDNYTAADGVLGAATEAETTLPDGGKRRDYAGGAIYWTSATCAHETDGAIFAEWQATGLAQGFLGYPLTNETRRRTFQSLRTWLDPLAQVRQQRHRGL